MENGIYIKSYTRKNHKRNQRLDSILEAKKMTVDCRKCIHLRFISTYSGYYYNFRFMQRPKVKFIKILTRKRCKWYNPKKNFKSIGEYI